MIFSLFQNKKKKYAQFKEKLIYVGKVGTQFLWNVMQNKEICSQKTGETFEICELAILKTSRSGIPMIRESRLKGEFRFGYVISLI